MTDPTAERIASELDDRGLAGPARLLADAHRPLAPLLSDLGTALGPLARALGLAPDTGELLGDERALDRVIRALDATGDRDARSR